MNAKRTPANDRRRRRLITLGWSAALLVTIIVLIAFEMTAVLYIVATIGVCGLLLVVAMADLGQSGSTANQSPSEKRDAPFIASGGK